MRGGRREQEEVEEVEVGRGGGEEVGWHKLIRNSISEATTTEHLDTPARRAH